MNICTPKVSRISIVPKKVNKRCFSQMTGCCEACNRHDDIRLEKSSVSSLISLESFNFVTRHVDLSFKCGAANAPHSSSSGCPSSPYPLDVGCRATESISSSFLRNNLALSLEWDKRYVSD